MTLCLVRTSDWLVICLDMNILGPSELEECSLVIFTAVYTEYPYHAVYKCVGAHYFQILYVPASPDIPKEGEQSRSIRRDRNGMTSKVHRHRHGEMNLSIRVVIDRRLENLRKR